MIDLKQFLSFLNDVDFQYVVLRNFDHLPYNVELGHHSDLDLLVSDLDHFLEIIPEATPEYPRPRVRFKLPLEENFIYMDVRHVGDGYYPTHFQKNILATREFWPDKGIWTPNYIHHQIALAYHAVHHKGAIAPDYRRFLGDAKLLDLLEALKSSPVGWVEPKDPSVGRFHQYWKGATSAVERQDGKVYKKQLGFMDYDLILNEHDFLVYLNAFSDCDFVPRYHHLQPDGTLIMEDCGETLNATNLPANWREQMTQILTGLEAHGVMHRDIRPDNFTVKNGKIYLIDYGWSVMREGGEREISLSDVERIVKIVKEPPAVLGFPFKPSDGFDDRFSMRAVIKHFEFLTEEQEAQKKGE